MKTLVFLATLIVNFLAGGANAIDFTPRFTNTIDDGFPSRRLYFTDGTRRIYYRPPNTWAPSGDDLAVAFRPKDSKTALIKFENGPAGAAGIAFDERGLEMFRKVAATLMPPGATDVTQTWEVVNPIILQGWTSFEVGFDYVHSGQLFCRSVVFINLDAKRQIRVIVDTVPADFQLLYKTAYRTLATWWEPAPGAGP